MQTGRSKDLTGEATRSDSASYTRLLLVGTEGTLRRELAQGHIFDNPAFSAYGAGDLIEGLSRLSSEAIDLVLLSSEFSSKELDSFVLEARTLGFAGSILHFVSSSMEAASSFARRRHAPHRGKARSLLRLDTNDSDARHANAELSDPINLRLTVKETAVLASVSEGLSNQQIARELDCSEGSVKAILQQLFEKTGVRKRAQLVRVALDHSLLESRAKRLRTKLVDVLGSASLGVLGRQELGPKSESAVARSKTEPIHVGDFVIDIGEHRVWVRGEEAHFTPLEFRLLTIFSKHPMRLMHHGDLAEVLWSSRPTSRDSLRSLVQAVRGKVETSKQPRYIATQPRCGYRFVPSPQPDAALPASNPAP